MKRLLQEPLVHFLLIGALLFGAYRAAGPASGGSASSQRIVLPMEEITHLVQLFEAQWRRLPTAEEFAVMVENRIREEVLYREALKMGLDVNDEIVRRRMAQKLQFVAEDVAESYEPTPDSLRAWFARHADRSAEPKRVSFRHLYFSPDRRGPNAEADARRALARLAGQPEMSPMADAVADPFMFQDFYRDQTAGSLTRELGPDFALAVDQLPAGSWQGPVRSGFGWHLVYVEGATPGRPAAYEDVEHEVRTAWLAEQKAEAWEKAYREMRARYTVLIPDMPDSVPPAGELPAPSPGETP